MKTMSYTNIDRRHTYGICLDTETANIIENANGQLDVSNALFYDLGFQVIDSLGRPYGKEFSFVNSDIFVHEEELMANAHFASKIPQYKADLASGKRVLATTEEIRQVLLSVIAEYGCTFVVAHNARFDYNALNTTLRYVTKSASRYFLPKNLEWWDSLKMARSVMGKMPSYVKFCKQNGFATKTGKPKFTAEVCYRFISKDATFVESHTGLEDVRIESAIFAYCHRQHKAMSKKLWDK